MDNEKKQEWTLEKEPAEKTGTEKTVNKEELADYILSHMPREMVNMLKEGKSVGEVMTAMENRKLKKENRRLKSELEKHTKQPLTLTSRGGEGEKDPFADGFMQAMAQF